MSETPPATPPATPPGTPPATPPATPPWHGLTAPEDVSYVENKGWKAAQDVVASYRGAEKLIGRDPSQLLVMPRADDPNGLMAVFDKLGRPATADKYEFAKPPEGITPDEKYMTWARDTFHKLGLLPGQVKELSAAHNAFVKDTLDAEMREYNIQVELGKKTLLNEWKGGHERMMNSAKTAANALGFSADMIDGIERSIGYVDTWKFFAELGKKMGEDTLATGHGRQNFTGTLTPEEANAEWKAKTLDPVFVAALKDKNHPGHAAAQAKQTELFKVMYPQ